MVTVDIKIWLSCKPQTLKNSSFFEKFGRLSVVELRIEKRFKRVIEGMSCLLEKRKFG